jgi:predicted DNA-binding ribbon-helix-helix protein
MEGDNFAGIRPMKRLALTLLAGAATLAAPPNQGKGSAMTASRLINRNVVAGRGRTSMRLEPELWDALMEICEREGYDVSTLVRRVEEAGHSGGRTSAVRVYILDYFRTAATEAGHMAVNHGPLSRARLAMQARSAA